MNEEPQDQSADAAEADFQAGGRYEAPDREALVQAPEAHDSQGAREHRPASTSATAWQIGKSTPPARASRASAVATPSTTPALAARVSARLLPVPSAWPSA